MAEDEGTPAPQPGKRKPWTLREVGGKPVWDWMDLLIVPIVVSLVTVAFTVVQDVRQQRIENQRAEAERELAEQRAQAVADERKLQTGTHHEVRYVSAYGSNPYAGSGGLADGYYFGQ